MPLLRRHLSKCLCVALLATGFWTVWRVVPYRPRSVITGHQLGGISADGQVIATFNDTDGPRLWSTYSGQELTREEREAAIEKLSELRFPFSPDGRYCLTHTGGRSRLWDVAQGTVIRKIAIDFRLDGVIPARFSPDSRSLIASQNWVFIQHLASGESWRRPGWFGYGPFCISADGELLASVSGANVLLYDLTNKRGEPLGSLNRLGQNSVEFCAISSDNRRLAVTTRDYAADWEVIARIAVAGASIDPPVRPNWMRRNRQKVIVPGKVHIWDLAEMKQLDSFPVTFGLFNRLWFSADGRTLVWSDISHKPTAVWDISGGPPRRLPLLPVKSGASWITPDGRLLANVTYDKSTAVASLTMIELPK